MRRRRGERERATTGRIALAHDWLVGMRGGEFVLDRIARVVIAQHTPAGLYTMFDAGKPMSGAIDGLEHVVSALGRRPWANASRRWLLWRYPKAVADLSRKLEARHEAHPIDLLISSHSAAIKAIDPPAEVPHLCYCHAPARYLWSQEDAYTRGGGVAARLRRLGLGLFGEKLRKWDRESVRRVTNIVANSRHTASIIERVWNREARVLYPPARTAFFTPGNDERQDFLLLVSALEPYKRVDLAIEAAIRAGKPLIVVGDGSQRQRLKKYAKSVGRQRKKAGLLGGEGLVQFTGRVGDEQLRSLYRRAHCLLFPQVEDFGIVAVEAQACGCPVVARRAGGASESVLEGRTGAFFEDPSSEEMADAIRRVPHGAEISGNCRVNAERFGEGRFDREIADAIERMLK